MKTGTEPRPSESPSHPDLYTACSPIEGHWLKVKALARGSDAAAISISVSAKRHMLRREISFEHAKDFLNIVLGVMIALPISGLPNIVINVLTAYERTQLLALILLVSALIFSTFYWLEARRFIEDVAGFRKALGETLLKDVERTGCQVTYNVTSGFHSLEGFAGGLLMISLLAAILKYAEGGRFRAFLVVNLAFWVMDLVSSIAGYRRNRLWSKVVGSFAPEYHPQQRWFNAHFQSCNFFDYGFINALLFLALLLLDYGTNSSGEYRIGAAIFILAFTVARHLFWRVRID